MSNSNPSAASAAAASSSSASGPSCRACSEETDLFAAMRRQLYETGVGDGVSAKSKPKSKKDQKELSATHSSSSNPPALAAESSSAAMNSSSLRPATIATAAWPQTLPCPPDNRRLGRAGWTLLHSIAAYYSEHPTASQQNAARSFLTALPLLYPCSDCAEHLATYYESNPPEQAVSGRSALSLFMCRMHNDVRKRQGKRLFDCSRVNERWGGHDWQPNDECNDDAEYCDIEEMEDQEL